MARGLPRASAQPTARARPALLLPPLSQQGRDGGRRLGRNGGLRRRDALQDRERGTA